MLEKKLRTINKVVEVRDHVYTTHVVNMNVSREKSRVKDRETKKNRQKPNVRESLSEKWIAILLKCQSSL
jgi:hypothetical protein